MHIVHTCYVAVVTEIIYICSIVYSSDCLNRLHVKVKCPFGLYRLQRVVFSLKKKTATTTILFFIHCMPLFDLTS